MAYILWGLWLLSWLLAATWSARTVARQPHSQRLLHITLLSAGVILLFWPPAAPTWLRRRLLPLPAWVAWGAVGLLLAGFAFAWWARVHLGRQWSANVTLKADHSLVRSGPYRMTRHPIYTGLLLATAGTVVIQDDVAAILGLCLILAGLVVKIRQEERLLGTHFGAAYATYRTEVPALIPRPW